MGLIDSIISVESGGNPNARNPNSSATGAEGSFSHARPELIANAGICKLLLARRPATILWGVVAIIVFAIKRVCFARARPHIGVKVLEAGPSVANFHAAPAVVFVRRMFRKSASAVHSVPNLVFGRRWDAFGQAARRAVSYHCVSSRASTAIGIAGPEIRNRNNLLCAAIALAKHLTDCAVSIFSDFWGGLGNGRQFTKFHANAVSGGCH